jgi:uncharacterized membrane protein
VKLAYLVRGLPGHPLHPPLTDVTIGAYTFATVAAFCDVVGISNHAATQGWWLAVFFGLISTVLTALAGFVDWLFDQSGDVALAHRDDARARERLRRRAVPRRAVDRA